MYKYIVHEADRVGLCYMYIGVIVPGGVRCCNNIYYARGSGFKNVFYDRTRFDRSASDRNARVPIIYIYISTRII